MALKVTRNARNFVRLYSKTRVKQVNYSRMQDIQVLLVHLDDT